MQYQPDLRPRMPETSPESKTHSPCNYATENPDNFSGPKLPE